MFIVKYIVAVTVSQFLLSSAISQDSIVSVDSHTPIRFKNSEEAIEYIREKELLYRNVEIDNFAPYSSFLPRNTEVQSASLGVRNGLEFKLIKYRNIRDGSIGSIRIDPI